MTSLAMKQKKAIVTGPTGVVGITLIEELVGQGIAVTAVCRPNSKRLAEIPRHPLVDVIQCSVDALNQLELTLPHDYDAFYHFAWDGTYGAPRQDMHRQALNITYTLDASHLAAALGCSVFIGAGSQSEFGHVDGILRPDMACTPDNGYGIAKLAAGWMSRIECQKLGLRHIWCRIVSLYGPHDGAHTMVRSTIQKLLAGERPQCTKGDQAWDYIYSKDAARAFRLAAEKGRSGAIYCLGTGKTRLLRDYIYAIRDAVDPALEVGIGEIDYYPNQVMHLEADISSLTADTGFVPQYSFEDGIKETVQWERMRRNDHADKDLEE